MTTLRVDLPLEIRATDEGDGRTLEGRLVPYDTPVEVAGVSEAFAAGVFADNDPADVVLLWQHDVTQPIGRMTGLTDSDDGAYGTFRLADTDRAREAASLAADGVIGGLSVGFTSTQASKVDGVRVHTKARLMETSLVTFAAYPTPTLAVRTKGNAMPPTDTPDVPDVDGELLPVEGLDLAPIEARLDAQGVELREVRNLVANIATPDVAPKPGMTLTAAFAKVLKMVAEKPTENRALADVIGTSPGNASGLIRDQYVAELLGYVNALRPMFSAAGKVGFPESGYGLAFPRITQQALVAKRATEKSEAASREVLIEAGNYPMEWFAGAVDVALELIAQSDPSVVEIVVASLMDDYARATELEFSADAAAAAGATGAVLSFATWAAFAAAVVDTSADIRAATGQPGNLLGLTSASWASLVVLLNPSQPAVLFGAGPDFTAESVPVAGITAFHAPALTVDMQFNAKSLRNSERPPETVTATNVALMGRDIGILGATISLPLYPAGIKKYAV